MTVMAAGHASLTAATLAHAMSSPHQHSLVFIGTYTDYSILPHWPHGSEEGDGFIVARWTHDRNLQPLHTVPVENPAVMK